MKTETLSIDLLQLDGKTQARISIHEDTVDDYAEIIRGSKDWAMEPLDVFHDGSNYFVADGFHRTLGALRAKRASIPCRVHKGTAKDARIFGMTANDRHGLRMSRADKRANVVWLLDCGDKMTQVEIAEKSGVDVRTVKRIVAEQKGTMSPSVSENTGKTFEPGTLSLSDKAIKTTKTSGGKAPVASQEPPGEGRNQQTQSDPDSAPNTETAADVSEDVSAQGSTAETGAKPDTAEAPNTTEKEPWRLARSKAKKTAEALQRALGDLNDVRKFAYLETALSDCREIITALGEMK